MQKVLRNTRPQFARTRQRRVRFERHNIERAQPHPKLDLVPARPNSSNDLPQNPRPVLERTAVLPWPRERAQKFVQQITMAMLDIHEIRADIPGNLCRRDVRLDKHFNFAVRPNLFVTRNIKLLVQDRMPVGHPRLHAKFIVRFAKPSRVSELKPNDQIIRTPIPFLMRSQQRLAQLRQTRFRLLIDHKLVRICPPIRPHRHRLTSPQPATKCGTAAILYLNGVSEYRPGQRRAAAFRRYPGPAIPQAWFACQTFAQSTASERQPKVTVTKPAFQTLTALRIFLA